MGLLARTKDLSPDEIQIIRRNYIGASDMARAMTGNFSRVVLEKAGLLEPFTGNESTYYGQNLEQFVADETGRAIAAALPGADIWITKADAIYQHDDPQLDFMTCSPDFWITISHPEFPHSGCCGVLETKTAKAKFLPDWEDGPAQYAHWQVFDQLEVLGKSVDFAIAACFVFVPTHRWHVVQKEPEPQQLLVRTALRAKELIDQAASGQLPQWTEADLDLDIVKATFPRSNGSAIDLPETARTLIESYKAHSAQERAATTAKEAAQAQLLQLLGPAERAHLGNYCLTWKNVETARLDGAALKAALPDVYAQFTKVSNYRRFNVSGGSDE